MIKYSRKNPVFSSQLLQSYEEIIRKSKEQAIAFFVHEINCVRQYFIKRQSLDLFEHFLNKKQKKFMLLLPQTLNEVN